ncbi:uncharacterized protein MELLADRAFT_70925 [Melampsora larici-populina 98AG31]|uniref:Uncharacterized protein n=1 Tax=Melampsora larici-populina (strain 98AG31 / pathotype 3-4-7) TaxID=747676 RepID=F4R9Q5_MELLP|nr:uncharacterized protein MELLADRAFT_70925 [Melampsora larici-populina 98AG31]EGG11107.1 hypothetical protein MELLADRAFT_70925 [Melampsora larici-populina 98AG31]
MSTSNHKTFVPSPDFSSNERDWQAEIGLLPWSTSIVFTKESLVRFLKQLEVEVDTNLTQLKKLPKHASFGTFPDEAPSTTSSQQPPTETRTEPQSDLPAFIPTRKVREQPGGGSAQIASLFGASSTDVSEAWQPTPIPKAPILTRIDSNKADDLPPPASTTSSELNITNSIKQDSITDRPRVVNPDGSAFVPTRKVREPVGGFSTMGSILGGN